MKRYRYNPDLGGWRGAEMSPREAYHALRREYRAARHADRKWRPDPYADRYHAHERVLPDTAGAFLARLPETMGRALAPYRYGMPAAASTRACFYAGWSPTGGRYHRLNLSARVALRSALLRAGNIDAAEAKADAKNMIKLARAAWQQRQEHA